MNCQSCDPEKRGGPRGLDLPAFNKSNEMDMHYDIIGIPRMLLNLTRPPCGILNVQVHLEHISGLHDRKYHDNN